MSTQNPQLLASKKSKTNSKQPLGITRLVAAWVEVQSMYFSRFQQNDRETSFAYRERPQVSLLGTAAFFCNGIALQEYALDKNSKRSGRNDLWLRLRSAGKINDYFAEAKHDWIGLENRPIPRLKKLLDEAVGSAKKIPVREEGGNRNRLALVFASVTYPSKELDNAGKRMTAFVGKMDAFSRKHRIHSWAAVWIKKPAQFFDEPGKQTSIGLIMLVKPLDKSGKNLAS